MAARKKGIEQHLEDAIQAAGANDSVGALQSLVSAWGIAPTDRIAKLVFALGARVPTPPIVGKSVTAREEAWLELAATSATSAVPTLLSLDWPVHPRAAKARMKLLRKFPPDPRIVRSLVELRKAGRYDSNAGYVLWGWAFETLHKWRYPAVHDVFATCLDGSADGIEMFRLEPLLARPRHPEPVLSGAAGALLAQLEGETVAPPARPSRAAQRAELFDAVYETPDDDAPRLVLSDFLIEDDDPRGEFIHLDMRLAREGKLPAKAMQRRSALARAAGKTWFEGLDPRLSLPELRRGFAASAIVSDPFDPSLRPHRTLERLSFPWVAEGEDAIARAVLDANLVSLRALHACNGLLFHALLRAGIPRRLERIDLSQEEWDEPTKKLDGAVVLTTHHLGIPNLAIATHLLATGSLAVMKVGTLAVDGDTETMLAIAARLERLPACITRAEVEHGSLDWCVSFTRAGNGRWTHGARWVGRGAPTLTARDELLARLPPDILPLDAE